MRLCEWAQSASRLLGKFKVVFQGSVQMVYLPFPFLSMSQNFEGEVASPGKRQAMPTMAMGESRVLLAMMLRGAV